MFLSARGDIVPRVNVHVARRNISAMIVSIGTKDGHAATLGNAVQVLSGIIKAGTRRRSSLMDHPYQTIDVTLCFVVLDSS